jgi:cytochrome c6
MFAAKISAIISPGFYFLLIFFSTNLQIQESKNTNTEQKKQTTLGEKLFLSNCITCHANGNNIIIPEKSLKKEILQTNGMDNKNAIIYQVMNGKNGMPAFGGRLKETEIEAIANYVLENCDSFGS